MAGRSREQNIADALHMGDAAAARRAEMDAETMGHIVDRDAVRKYAQEHTDASIDALHNVEQPEQPLQTNKDKINPVINPQRQQVTGAGAAKNLMANHQPPEQEPVPNADTQKIEAPELNNTIPSWRDYMRKTSGGKGGMISRIAAGAAQTIGASLLRGAAGGSGGRFGDANAEVTGDPFGMQSFREFQHGHIQNQQDLERAAGEANIGEQVADNTQARNREMMELSQQFEEKMQDKGFRDSMMMLAQNFEQQKEMLGLTTQQQQALQQFSADLAAGYNVRAFHALARSGITKNEMADFIKRVQGHRRFDDIIGILGQILGRSSGGFTGRGGKHEPAGIVHKGEHVVPKKDVDQSTGLPKRSYLARIANAYAVDLSGQPLYKDERKQPTFEEKIAFLKRCRGG